jgi:hypothetical protein
MTPRAIALCVLLSGTGLACMNTSQPRSRHSVSDGVITPVKAVADAHVVESVRHTGHDPAETPDVESEPVAGSRLSRSRAVVLVRAPLERVRAVLLDFPNYHAFLPNYRSAKVEATLPDGGSRVHMQIDGLGGMIRRWMRVEISAPVVAGPRVSFEAKLLEGDVKAFAARWVLDRVDEGATRLTLESFLDPDLQLPATFIDSGSAAGLKESILAIKARAEDGAI